MSYELIFSPELLIAFLTLFVLELVLGVDNIIFISILASKLPVEQQAKARNLGLSLAMVLRIGLVAAAGWIVSLTDGLFSLFGMEFSGRDLILIFGGLFLLYKAVTEIHHKIDGDEEHESSSKVVSFGAILAQILMMDIVFSFDSVITAVGMVDNFWVIIFAVIASFALMLFAAKWVFTFVDRNPSVKMLALSFLVLIGAMLIAEGFDVHVNKAFIYGPVAFAIGVEALNLLYRRERKKDSSSRLNESRSRTSADDALAAGRGSGTDGGSLSLSRRPVTAAGRAKASEHIPNTHGSSPAKRPDDA